MDGTDFKTNGCESKTSKNVASIFRIFLDNYFFVFEFYGCIEISRINREVHLTNSMSINFRHLQVILWSVANLRGAEKDNIHM